MSWLFSQALVEEYLAGTCSDGEQSALLSGNPIPQAYCAPDKMTAFSRLSRFGMTFKPLTDTLGEELLTLYRADFPAKTLVPQGAGQELTGKNPACGNTWRESLGRYDHSTHTLKTAQCSLFEDSTLSSPTLPRWGSMRTGELFRRQTLVRPTAATESGLWPTPTSTLGTNGGSVTPSKGREGGTLIEALSARTLWPTPTVCGNYNRKGLSATSGDGLATAVATWPTPNASDCEQGGTTQGNRRTPNLSIAVHQRWPTPQASDNRNRGNADTPAIAKRISAGKQVMLTMTVSGGQLNPTWVEWLMGWPLGWTDLKPLEMDKYQQWLQQHGVY